MRSMGIFLCLLCSICVQCRGGCGCKYMFETESECCVFECEILGLVVWWRGKYRMI